MEARVLHYTIVVLVVLTVSVLFSSFSTMSKRSKKWYLLASLGFLAFLTMFHGVEVGNDTAMYIDRFQSIARTGDLFAYIKSTTMEPGYLVFNYVLSRFTNNPQILFIASGLLVYSSLGLFLYRNCAAPGLAVFCVTTMQFFDMFLSGVRQALALAILLFAYSYIAKRKPVPFFLLVVLAALFHYTALLFAIAYPAAVFSLNREGRHQALRVLLVIVCIVAVYVWFDTLLSVALALFPKYSYYIGSAAFAGEPNLAIILRTIVYLLMFLIPRWLLANEHRAREVDEGVARLSACNIILAAVSMNASVLGRLCMYFSPFSLVDYANNTNRLSREASVILTVLSLILLFFYGLTIVVFRMPAWYSTYPFSLCFF